jgi:hypothetical protein
MDREIRLIRLAAMAAAILSPALAAAQAPPTAKPQTAPSTEQRDPKSCAQAPSTVGLGGDLKVDKPANSSLSDQLARSDGVICPPEKVDPAIKAPTPEGGAMPVIPPPGSPGGDQSVQPK